MTQLQVTFDEETLREALFGDKGAELLLETVMNEILQAEMTEHLRAGPGEQTDERRGYRNGSYQRRLEEATEELKDKAPAALETLDRVLLNEGWVKDRSEANRTGFQSCGLASMQT